MGEALALVPTLLRDPSEQVARSAAELVGDLRDDLLPEALEPNYTRFLRKTFAARARKLGWRTRRNESEETRALQRSLVELAAVDGGDPVLVKEAIRLAGTWLDKRTGIDPEMLDLVLATAGRHGDAALHEHMEQVLFTTEDRRERQAIIGALAQARDIERVNKNQTLFMSGKLDIREAGALLFEPMYDRKTRDTVYAFIKEHYEPLVAMLPHQWRTGMIHMAGVFCDQEHLDDVKAFFGPKAENAPGGPKALAQTLERIQLCMALRATQQPSIEAFFEKQ
jgi:alanyl aminopeptidase